MQKPDKNVHRVLLSTTSRLIGEVNSPDLDITHAIPGIFGNPKSFSLAFAQGHLSRTYLVLSFRIEPEPAGAAQVNPIPNFSPVGERVSIALSALYGKRFDHHGFLISHGIYSLPDTSDIRPCSQPNAAFHNHQPRPDIGIPLDLTEFARLLPLFIDGRADGRLSQLFFTAGAFYQRAVQIYESHPALAYLDLVTCGEVIANFYEYSDADLYDYDTAALFVRIAAELRHGEQAVAKLKGRMRQIKRAFVLSVLRLLSDQFFSEPPGDHPWTKLSRDGMRKAVMAAYDLRSRYVHTGVDFGRWVSPFNNPFMSETQMGRPMLDDKEYAKVLERAPTLVGLERIMRFCLLRLLHTNGISVSPRLDGPGLATPHETHAPSPEIPPGTESTQPQSGCNSDGYG